MNKKIILLLAVVALAMTPLFSEVTFGAKGALSDFSFTGADWDDLSDAWDLSNDISLSFSLGAFAEVDFSKNFAFQPEVNYTRATVKYSGTSDYWTKETFNMIKIPAYVKFMQPVGNGSFYALAGPEFSLIMGDIQYTNSEDYDDTIEPDTSFLLGMGLGVGYELQSGLSFGMKYSREFTQMEEDTDIYLASLELEIGYKF